MIPIAERRMFSKRIINSARFLKMPVSSQCLYFHLGLHADDDGIVEAYTVMNSVGASEDDLKILVVKGFLLVLNDDLVSYITDWRENNKIRADRKVDSIYKDLLVQMLPDADIQQKKQRADTAKRLLQSPDFENGQPKDVQWTTNGQPMDGIGKDRIGKVSIGEDSISPPKATKPTRHKYGEYKNVLLSDEDMEKLKAEFPHDWQQRIERLSGYIASTGKSYKNHLATIRNWAKRDNEKGAAEKKQKNDGWCMPSAEDDIDLTKIFG